MQTYVPYNRKQQFHSVMFKVRIMLNCQSFCTFYPRYFNIKLVFYKVESAFDEHGNKCKIELATVSRHGMFL